MGADVDVVWGMGNVGLGFEMVKYLIQLVMDSLKLNLSGLMRWTLLCSQMVWMSR